MEQKTDRTEVARGPAGSMAVSLLNEMERLVVTSPTVKEMRNRATAVVNRRFTTSMTVFFVIQLILLILSLVVLDVTLIVFEIIAVTFRLATAVLVWQVCYLPLSIGMTHAIANTVSFLALIPGLIALRGDILKDDAKLAIYIVVLVFSGMSMTYFVKVGTHVFNTSMKVQSMSLLVTQATTGTVTTTTVSATNRECTLDISKFIPPQTSGGQLNNLYVAYPCDYCSTDNIVLRGADEVKCSKCSRATVPEPLTLFLPPVVLVGITWDRVDIEWELYKKLFVARQVRRYLLALIGMIAGFASGGSNGLIGGITGLSILAVLFASDLALSGQPNPLNPPQWFLDSPTPPKFELPGAGPWFSALLATVALLFGAAAGVGDTNKGAHAVAAICLVWSGLSLYCWDPTVFATRYANKFAGDEIRCAEMVFGMLLPTAYCSFDLSLHRARMNLHVKRHGKQQRATGGVVAPNDVKIDMGSTSTGSPRGGLAVAVPDGDEEQPVATSPATSSPRGGMMPTKPASPTAAAGSPGWRPPQPASPPPAHLAKQHSSQHSASGIGSSGESQQPESPKWRPPQPAGPPPRQHASHRSEPAIAAPVQQMQPIPPSSPRRPAPPSKKFATLPSPVGGARPQDPEPDEKADLPARKPVPPASPRGQPVALPRAPSAPASPRPQPPSSPRSNAAAGALRPPQSPRPPLPKTPPPAL